MTRRALLAATAGTVGALGTGCSLRPPTAGAAPAPAAGVLGAGSAADEVTGPFDPRRAAGAALHVLLMEGAPATLVREEVPDFTRRTGIAVRVSVVPEAQHYDRVTTELVSGLPDVDVFATAAPMVWQYAAPGWMEDLDPWLGNHGATADGYDVDDVLPQAQDALRWDGTFGRPAGAGPRWALPWSWRSTALTYRADVLARLGLRPPETLAALEQVAREAHALMATEAPGEGYGLAVRGARSWDTVQAGFATQLAREGGADFDTSTGHLVPVVDSAASVAFHQRWAALVAAAGSRRWAEHTHRNCSFDLGSGRAAMMYDSTSGALALDAAGASPAAGRLAWSPGPAGADGSTAADLWVSSLAISSRSQQKLAAWLFLQWATGARQGGAAALRAGVDPVRRSVLASAAFRDARAAHPGYLETLDAALATARPTSTPQPSYFDTTTAWAGALQECVGGAGAELVLSALAERMRQRS